MELHIHTQYVENYGDANDPYWKFKGGTTFVVTGFDHPLSDGIGDAAKAAVESVRDHIEKDNNFFREYILDWEICFNSQMTEHEELQLKYDGKITYPSPRIDLKEVQRA